MFIQEGPVAASYTDDTSPNLQHESDRKVSIHAQVVKEKPLDWYYTILNLYRDVSGELKSDKVIAGFYSLSENRRDRIWQGLKGVRINVVDTLPYQAPYTDVFRKAFGRDDVLEMLKYKAKHNDDFAKRILYMMEESVGKMVIESAPAKQFMRFVWMTKHPYGSLGWYMQKNEMRRARYGDPYFDMPLDSLDISVFQNKKRLNLTKAVKWTSKSGSVFNYGIDNLIEDMGVGNSFYAQYKIFRSLNQSHAFDRGDNQAVQWLDSSRREVIRRAAHQVSLYYPKDLRPLYGDVDSTSSFYTQAADIAAGFARHLYQQQGIISLTDKFEYVTFNGQRISRADAEEKMREWEREGYIQNTKKVIYQS